MHNILHEFKFWPIGTTDQVSCPCVSIELSSTLFLGCYLSDPLNLKVTKTCIRSWMSTNFCQIRTLTVEFDAI